MLAAWNGLTWFTCCRLSAGRGGGFEIANRWAFNCACYLESNLFFGYYYFELGEKFN